MNSRDFCPRCRHAWRWHPTTAEVAHLEIECLVVSCRCREPVDGEVATAIRSGELVEVAR